MICPSLQNFVYYLIQDTILEKILTCVFLFSVQLFFSEIFFVLRRVLRRWEDNIKMDLQEVGRGCGDWMGLAQDRDRWRALVSTVMNSGVP